MSFKGLTILVAREGERALDPVQTLTLFDELRAEGETTRSRAYDLALTNERWCIPRAGAGLWSRAQSRGRSQAEYFGGVYGGGSGADGVTLECMLLPDLLATWTSLITRARPSAVVVPGPKVATDDNPLAALERSAQAANATALLEYFESEFQFTSMIDDVVRYGGIHGTAGLLVDLVDGKLRGETVYLPDLFLEDRQKFEDVDWMMHRTWTDEYTAYRMVQASTVSTVDKQQWPRAQTYYTIDGIEHAGVEVLDLWYRPSSRLPKGLRARLIDGQLVVAKAYELKTETDDGGLESWLPLSLFRVSPDRNGVFGDTWMTRCIDWQRTLNEAWSRQLQLFRQTQKALLLMPKSMFADDGGEAVNPDPGVAAFDDVAAEAIKQVRYVVPPTLDSGLQTLKTQARDAMFEIAGMHTADSLKGDSGRAVAYKEDLDLQKNQSTAKDLERCVLDFWRVVLGSVQVFYPQARQQAISGGLSDLQETDLAGVDIRLEPRSSWDGLTTTKQFNAAQAIAEGALSPGVASLERGDVLALANAAAAQAVVEQLLATGEVDLDPTSFPQPEILIDVVNRAFSRALRARDTEAAEMLQDFQAALLLALAGQAPAPGVDPEAAAAPTPPPGDMDVDRAVPAELMAATDLSAAPDLAEATEG